VTALRTQIEQDDFSIGMVRDAAQELIPETGAYDMVNALLDEDGSPYRRGGTAYLSDTPGEEEVLDDFNRADENPVSKSGEWLGAFIAPPTSREDAKVENNKLVADSPISGSAVFDKTVSDGFVYATLAATSGYAVFQLLIRSANESSSSTCAGYFLEASGTTVGSWFFSLIKVASGKQTILKGASPVPVAVGDKLGLKATGSAISVWHQPSGGQWTELFAVTDTALTSGRIGVGVGGEGAALDNFGVASAPHAIFSSKGLTFLWDGYLLPGARTLFADTDNFGVLDSEEEQINLGGAGLDYPKQSAALDDLLFIGGGAIYGGSRKTAAYSTGTVTVTKGSKVVKGAGVTWSTLVDTGMLFQVGSERVYVVETFNSSSELTLRDAYEGTGGGAKTYTLHNVFSGSGPYVSWDYVTVCANRLVVMSGRTIKVTEIDNPHTFTNHLGTTNEHTLPEGVEGLGLATVGQSVLAFHTGGIHVLSGLALDIVDQNGNPQHQLQRLSEGTVLAGAAGIAGNEQQLVVPCEDGIYLMDGVSQPVRISRPIERYYRQRIEAGYRPGRAAVFRGHYFLPIITSAGAVRSLLVCRLDRATRSRSQGAFPWSRFTGDGGELTAFAVRSAISPVEPQLLGAQARTPSQVVDCSAYFQPDQEHSTDADGSVHDLDVIARAYQTGSGTINRVRALKARYELAGAEGRLKAYYSDGSAKGGGAKFGTAIFGKDRFAGEDGGASFTPIGDAGESDGRNPARFRVNKAFRYVRIRVKSDGPAAYCALRALELTIRPSGATRR
jgi:hypothetical protein